MQKNQTYAACLLGALVADAASLGQHWIYDVDRIATVTAQNNGHAAFVPIDAKNYEGVRSYFAHGKRTDGMLSQYGETLRLAIKSMIKHGGKFDTASYQQDYVDVFGAGGSYQGYIDRPTRGSLENIANEMLDPSGIDDDQFPATSRLPAIVVTCKSSENFADEVKNAIAVTNTHADAYAYGQLFADLLSRILDGADIDAALKTSAEQAPEPIRQLLMDALNTDEDNSVAYGEITGRACHLPMGMPLMFHILTRSQSYAEAMETNIRAGGDNCGRAIMFGAIMGAKYGITTPNGIPLEWILKTHDGLNIWQECQKLISLT